MTKRFIIEEPNLMTLGRKDAFGGEVEIDNAVFMYLGTARIVSKLSGLIHPDSKLPPFSGMEALGNLGVDETMIARFCASGCDEEYYVRRTM
jgi:hypothetical protein